MKIRLLFASSPVLDRVPERVGYYNAVGWISYLLPKWRGINDFSHSAPR